MSIYQFSVKKQNGDDLSLQIYKNKVLLIVNTATDCGFTPQYQGLQELYQKYQAAGLEILDFPCNQFHRQAPGSAEEINEFCSIHYQTTFPRFKKIEVNGSNASPLFSRLKEEKGGIFSKNIKWNFTKFLIDRKGNVIKRYPPQTLPKEIEQDILQIL